MPAGPGEGESFSQFALQIDGVTTPIARVSGLGQGIEVVEVREADAKGQTIITKRPGRTGPTDLVLTRGVTDSLYFADWRRQVEEGAGEFAQHDGEIVAMDNRNEPIVRWSLTRAWPSKLVNRTTTDGLVEEEITLVSESIERVTR